MAGDRLRRWLTGNGPAAKVARGAVLAFGGAAGVLLLEQIAQALSHAAAGGVFGAWSPLVAAALSVALNILRQYSTPADSATPQPGT